jgi:hypothetical protein
MSVNHRLIVELREKGKGKGNGSKVSSLTNLRNSRAKQEDSSSNAMKNVLRFSRMIRSQDVGAAIGLFGNIGGLGIAMSTLQELNKWHDLSLDYRAAVTGETVYAGNLKKTKSYILSLGGAYIQDAIQNHLFTRNIVHRQNIQNQYYRDLYFEKFEGNQYGGKK